MPPHGKSPGSLGEDETFVTIIQVAQEDPAVRETLLSVLSLDPFNRRSVLSSFIRDLETKGAPEDFTGALANLLDDEVACEVLRLLGRD